MRSLYTSDEFLLVAAKKKPRLQALVDRATLMTEAEIEALSEPLWVKQGLNTLRLSGGSGQKERIAAIVNRVEQAEKAAAALPKKTYEVRLWDCSSDYIGRNDVDRSWKIQVDRGDVFMLCGDSQVRFGDSTVIVDDHSMFTLMHCSKLVGYMTLDHYKGFKQALINQRHKL